MTKRDKLVLKQCSLVNRFDQLVGWIRENSDETMKFRLLGIHDIQMPLRDGFMIKIFLKLPGNDLYREKSKVER